MMKYFEFNNHAYYGLIGASDIKSAKFAFYEWVCDQEEDDGEPNEISRETAKEKYELACMRYGELQSFDYDEINCVDENNCWLVLIDGALL